MATSNRPEKPAFIHDIHAAPIRKRWHSKLRETCQGCLVIERRRQDFARIRKKGRSSLGSFRLLAQLSLAVVEISSPKRRRRQVSEHSRNARFGVFKLTWASIIEHHCPGNAVLDSKRDGQQRSDALGSIRIATTAHPFGRFHIFDYINLIENRRLCRWSNTALIVIGETR